MKRRFATGVAIADDIYRRYAPRTYSIALRMLGCPDGAEAVTQEVLLRAGRRLNAFRGESAICQWTINAVFAHRRKAAAVGPTCRSRSPAMLLDDEEREPMEVAIGHLPEAYRDTFVLAEVEQFPHAEICELLGLSLAEVKSRLHHARLRLCEALQPYFLERSG